ncbi:MAG: dockerin type I domain-containing protein [Clostridiales bacterium]|nr:dockerin type I domain-containing protein [Clostridiales bacterium]
MIITKNVLKKLLGLLGAVAIIIVGAAILLPVSVEAYGSFAGNDFFTDHISVNAKDVEISLLDFYPDNIGILFQEQFEIDFNDIDEFAYTVSTLYRAADNNMLYYGNNAVYAWNLNAAKGTSMEDFLPGIVEKKDLPLIPEPNATRLIRNNLINASTNIEFASTKGGGFAIDEDNLTITNEGNIPLYFKIQNIGKIIYAMDDTISLKLQDGWYYCNMPLPVGQSYVFELCDVDEWEDEEAFLAFDQTSELKVEFIQATNNAVYFIDGWKEAAGNIIDSDWPTFVPFFIRYIENTFSTGAKDVSAASAGSYITGDYSVNLRDNYTVPVFFRFPALELIGATTAYEYQQLNRVLLIGKKANSQDIDIIMDSEPWFYEISVDLKLVDGYWYCNTPLSPDYLWEIKIKHDAYISLFQVSNNLHSLMPSFAHTRADNIFDIDIIQATANAVFVAEGWKDAAGSIGDPFFIIEQPQNEEATISGQVLYQASTTPATVELWNAGDKINSVSTGTDGTFALSATLGEDYKLVITKAGYLTYTITGIDLTDDLHIGQPDLRLMAGDVNGDGVVNAEDLTHLLSDFNKAPLGKYDTDIDGSGIVNAIDLTYLLAGFNKQKVEIDYKEIVHSEY